MNQVKRQNCAAYDKMDLLFQGWDAKRIWMLHVLMKTCLDYFLGKNEVVSVVDVDRGAGCIE
jgi:hypothetical protein